MQRMSHMLLVFVLNVLAINSVSATSVKPSTCPDITAIKQAGLTHAVELFNFWTVSNVQGNKYGTSNTWGFLMMPIAAENESMAFKVANQALLTMNLSKGPYPDEDELGNTQWICEYKNKEDPNLTGYATTPFTGTNASILNFAKHP